MPAPRIGHRSHLNDGEKSDLRAALGIVNDNVTPKLAALYDAVEQIREASADQLAHKVLDQVRHDVKRLEPSGGHIARRAALEVVERVRSGRP